MHFYKGGHGVAGGTIEHTRRRKWGNKRIPINIAVGLFILHIDSLFFEKYIRIKQKDQWMFTKYMYECYILLSYFLEW